MTSKYTPEPVSVDYSVPEVMVKSRGSHKFKRRSAMKALQEVLGFHKNANACRIYGSMDIHRVEGELHFTAAGHGYYDLPHLQHDRINFSHIINELSFGEYYEKLIDPLDGVAMTTNKNFQQYQYFVNIVPTAYKTSGKVIQTNQYSATSQSRAGDERTAHGQFVPGIFFKYDVEPYMLNIYRSRPSLVNTISKLLALFGGVVMCVKWAFSMGNIMKNQRAASEGRLLG